MALHRTLLMSCDQFSDQGCPAGLMAGSQAHSIVTMKIFVEKMQMFIARLLIKPIVLAMLRYAVRIIRLKQTDHALGQKIRHFFQVHKNTRTHGTFYFQFVTIKYSIFTDRLNNKVVDRHPDGSPPVGVSPKKI